jgi:crotonobetainyl-CoA:carnitine CoA-transferase CaiB-like acyl-CoA transferase
MRLLQDIRVLDLGGFITGPYTAALLADFGADVVKVERPGGGDPFRALRDDLYSPQFQAHNQNKRSLTLDFTRPEGLEALHLIVRTADVFIINNRPRVADKLGIGHDVLCSINPRLIYCSITGFGSDGPYADRPAFDHVGQALSGWMSRHHQGDESRVAGPAIADRITSYYAAIGMLAALHDRDRSGKARLIEVNMVEANIALCVEPLVKYFDSGQPVPLYLRAARICAPLRCRFLYLMPMGCPSHASHRFSGPRRRSLCHRALDFRDPAANRHRHLCPRGGGCGLWAGSVSYLNIFVTMGPPTRGLSSASSASALSLS